MINTSDICPDDKPNMQQYHEHKLLSSNFCCFLQFSYYTILDSEIRDINVVLFSNLS